MIFYGKMFSRKIIIVFTMYLAYIAIWELSKGTLIYYFLQNLDDDTRDIFGTVANA